MDFSAIEILSPKQAQADGSGVYPYYAGYSAKFATALLSSAKLDASSNLLDPWNGAGKTTSAGARLGLKGFGFDLNPVMVIAARAALLSYDEAPSIISLSHALVKIAEQLDGVMDEEDPLNRWLAPSSSRHLRAIEHALNKTLISEREYFPIYQNEKLQNITPLGAFFYVALFRSTRQILSRFIPSNPTWVREPESLHARLRPSRRDVVNIFLSESEKLSKRAASDWSRTIASDPVAQVQMANAISLPVDSSSIDIVLTSPPYCTRIDYAVATSIELACLRMDKNTYAALRKSLMGTSTVPANAPSASAAWGDTCISFLDAVSQHPSKASNTYYLKSHLEYFDSLHKATAELARVIRCGGTCVVVAQDSFYKDVHNNVPLVIAEMMSNGGFELRRREDFSASRSMASINPKARRYKNTRENVESVLCFQKT